MRPFRARMRIVQRSVGTIDVGASWLSSADLSRRSLKVLDLTHCRVRWSRPEWRRNDGVSHHATFCRLSPRRLATIPPNEERVDEEDPERHRAGRCRIVDAGGIRAVVS